MRICRSDSLPQKNVIDKKDGLSVENIIPGEAIIS
jgi:hypothetical protein